MGSPTVSQPNATAQEAKPSLAPPSVPNKAAKQRKQKKAALNKKLSIEGRTSKQYKKWLKKKKETGNVNPVFGRGR